MAAYSGISPRCGISCAVRLSFRALGLALFACSPGYAASLTFECTGSDSGRPVTLSLKYDGDAQGMLTGTSSFGPVSLKATMQSSEEAYEGKTRTVVMVDASGTTKVKMPDPAAFEACLAAKKSEDDADGTLAILSCQSSIADAAEPIAADLFVKIVIDPFVFEDAAAEVRRRYAESSATLGRKVTLEALPPLGCTSTAIAD